jgi:predicted Zn-dependent protease
VNRPHFILTLLIALSSTAYAELEKIEHKIPPGYEPSEAQDEQGLWMELEEYEIKLNKSALLVRDPELNNYIKGIVCRVAGDYCNDFRVYLIRNPGFNASMTATGMMQIWTGLLVRSSSSDEIAAVVGHEIAHYTRMHTLERFRRLKSSSTAGGLIDIGISIFTGVSTPLAQSMAAMNALAFSRDQEQEADLLGAQLLHEASMDPHAAYRVWQNIIAEEEAAAVKRRSPGIFSQTHPDEQSRVDVTRDWVTAKYGPPDVEPSTDEALLTIMNNHYYFLMEDQIDTNRFGRTKELLERHSEMGVEPGKIYYFYGEMFRQRGAEGDRQMAMSAYRHSIETGNAPADAYRNLGYLHLKEKDMDAAIENFTIFLEQEPEATDRAMIEFYINEG